MDIFLKPKFISLLIIASALLTLAGVMVGSIEELIDESIPIYPHVGLFIFIGILFVIMALPLNLPTYVLRLLVGFCAVIIISMFIWEPDIHSSTGTLFFVLCGITAILLTPKESIGWIVAFYLLTLGAEFWFRDSNDWVGWLSASGGFLFFGIFGMLLRQSNVATREANRLAADLAATNEELRTTRQKAEQVAIVEERNRLAREMHDSLGHRLTVAVVQLEGAQRLIADEPDWAADIIGDMRRQLKEGLTELRQTLSSLRSDGAEGVISAEITQQPFPNHLHTLSNTFSKATALPIHVKIPTDLPTLTSQQQHALYRAAQEGLTNVERHANATEAWLNLSAESNTITLTVSDDGCGIPDQLPDGRFGLLGLRERADQHGGTVTLSPRQPRGSVLAFTIRHEA